MPFNLTTGEQNGLIQQCEFWCGLAVAGISGNSANLKQFTVLINNAFDRLMPTLLSMSDYLRWDDSNHTDLPVGTFSIVSGQSDYTIAQDDNSLDILNITNVRIYPSATATQYLDVREMTMDDPRAVWAMSPNSTDIGVPTHFLPRGNTIFFWPQPNYSATNGAKIYFEREKSAFLSTDTTKEAGIPLPFQSLLAQYASYDWLVVNKPGNGLVVQSLAAEIKRREGELRTMINARDPHRSALTMAFTSYR